MSVTIQTPDPHERRVIEARIRSLRVLCRREFGRESIESEEQLSLPRPTGNTRFASNGSK